MSNHKPFIPKGIEKIIKKDAESNPKKNLFVILVASIKTKMSVNITTAQVNNS